MLVGGGPLQSEMLQPVRQASQNDMVDVWRPHAHSAMPKLSSSRPSRLTLKFLSLPNQDMLDRSKVPLVPPPAKAPEQKGAIIIELSYIWKLPWSCAVLAPV